METIIIEMVPVLVIMMMIDCNNNSNDDHHHNINNNNKEGRHFLFNNVLNTFYLGLYGVRHTVKDNSESQRRNPLLPLHGLCFSINSIDSLYAPSYTEPLLHQLRSTGWNEK